MCILVQLSIIAAHTVFISVSIAGVSVASMVSSTHWLYFGTEHAYPSIQPDDRLVPALTAFLELAGPKVENLVKLLEALLRRELFSTTRLGYFGEKTTGETKPEDLFALILGFSSGLQKVRRR